MKTHVTLAALGCAVYFAGVAEAQIGRRFPSGRKVVKDPVTGTLLTFLTSSLAGDAKIYQTHNQWTANGQWLIFRSGRQGPHGQGVGRGGEVMPTSKLALNCRYSQ